MLTASIISAAVGAISAGIGAYSSYKARKQQEKLAEEQRRAAEEEKARIEEKEAERKAAFEAEYNTPTLEREENRAAMSMTNEAIADQTRRDDNKRAMMGGSAEQAVANRAKNMALVGSLARDLAAAGTQYKAQLKASYEAGDNQLSALRAGLTNSSATLAQSAINSYGKTAASGTQLMANGISAAGNAAGEYFKWKSEKEG